MQVGLPGLLPWAVRLARRAHVTVASVGTSLEVKCSRGVKLVADALIDDCTGHSYDLIALPVSTAARHAPCAMRAQRYHQPT